LRDSATDGVVQKSPTSMPLTPNVARSVAIARYQQASFWQSAPVAIPSTVALSG
jgi:hypothetical protein